MNTQIYEWNKKSLKFFEANNYEVHEGLMMIGKILEKRANRAECFLVGLSLLLLPVAADTRKWLMVSP